MAFIRFVLLCVHIRLSINRVLETLEELLTALNNTLTQEPRWVQLWGVYSISWRNRTAVLWLCRLSCVSLPRGRVCR